MHVSLIWKWHEVKENFSPHPKTNVVIAAFVTAQARLKRYFLLELFSEPIIYAGTDSLVLTQKPDEVASNTGEFLNDITNEIDRYAPQSFIEEFVSGGPKIYAFRANGGTKNHPTACKVRVITL